MIIGSIIENQEFEKRIAITLDVVKKYISLGFEVVLQENYGNHLGISDKDYSDLGVKIYSDYKKVLQDSDIIVQLGLVSDDKTSLLKENQSLIGVLNPYLNKDKLLNLAKKKFISFRSNYFLE